MKNNDSFSQIFEFSPVPTIILSGEFPNVFVKEANAAYVALTGRFRQEIVGTPFFITAPHPSMRMESNGYTDVKRSIEKVFIDKTPVKTPVQKFLKPIPETGDTETLYLEAINTPVVSNDGEIQYIIRTLQNVTETVVARQKEKAKDARLIENEKFLRDTQNVAKIGSWEIDKDNKVYWSDIHYEIMEVEPGTEITVDFCARLLKEKRDRDTFQQVYEMATKKGEYFDVELNIVTLKGNERWVRLIGKGELHDGKFVRMQGVGRDITEQKKIQLQLLDSRNRLETLIQTVDGIVFEADAQTLEFTFVSEQVEELMGYTPGECIHQPGFLDRVLHPADKPKILKLTFIQIQQGKNYTGDYRFLRKDGTLIWMKVSVSVIHQQGSPRWLRGLMIDITATKRIAELERLEKEMLELNAKASETTANILTTYLRGIECIFPEMRCSIMQVKQGRLFNWAASSLPSAYIAATDNLPIFDNMGSCGTAAFNKQKVIVSDIANDPRWQNFKDIALQHDLRSCWSQPITNADGEVIATLGMYYSTVKVPTEDEIKVIDRTVNLLQVILQDRHNVELLEEANFLMKQSQELARFGSLQLDIRTGELTWSNELYNIFGIDTNVKPTGELYYNALHPEDKQRILAKTDEFLKTRKDYVAELRVIRPDGELRNLKTWGRVKTDEKGEAIKVIAAYIDITESKKVQEDLLASESRLRSLVDSQTNYVVRTDFRGNYNYANKKYIEDFGLVPGKSLLGTNALATVLPHHRERVKEVSVNCITHPNEVFEVELEKYGLDGSIKYSFWHFICLTNSKGEPTELQCIGIDISDRKKAINELEESEKRYSDLFHLSPQSMWVYDLDTLQFLDVNVAAIQQYGYSEEEFLSMTIKDIRPPSHIPKLLEVINNRKSDDDFFQGVFTHQKKNGELIQVDVKRNRIPFKGRIVHLVLANNITERLEHQDALEKQNERLSEIAWIQSHVVRAPLARIMGIADVLDNYTDDQLDQKLLLKNIVSSAHELDKIVRDIVNKAEQIKLAPRHKSD